MAQTETQMSAGTVRIDGSKRWVPDIHGRKHGLPCHGYVSAAAELSWVFIHVMDPLTISYLSQLECIRRVGARY